MKRNIIIYTALLFAATPLFTGCLEETNPTNGMTQRQLDNSATGIEALNNAIPTSLLSVGSNTYGSLGYAGTIMLNNDAMGAEIPLYSSGYDYYSWYMYDTGLGETSKIGLDRWTMYYDIINKCNLTIAVGNSLAEQGTLTATQQACDGNARAYRAMMYLQLAQQFDYQNTGIAALDQQAATAGILGLTVPIVTEKTTEQEARHNARAPFYEVYRFILTDLNRAEEELEGYTRSYDNVANLGVVYGLKARLWLTLGSRFELSADDLATAIQHEGDTDYDKLGVTTATQCFANAATYAERAIAEGFTPTSKSEWFSATTGFNTATSGWMLASNVAKENISSLAAYQNFIAVISPEADFGVANTTYNAIREIDASLYSTIEKGDWRRTTWIDPNDEGRSSAYGKYSTLLTASEWASCPAYTSFKFHPGSGNRTDYTVGAVVAIPLMRVEEMYLIDAEAKAHADGLDAGKAALASFLNGFRYDDGSYTCTATTMDAFNDEILRQRRIEFWGEGIVMYDYKRLHKAVIRKYDGTNFLEAFQFNSLDGYVAPRMNLCFPRAEMAYNEALINNPDPSGQH